MLMMTMTKKKIISKKYIDDPWYLGAILHLLDIFEPDFSKRARLTSKTKRNCEKVVFHLDPGTRKLQQKPLSCAKKNGE